MISDKTTRMPLSVLLMVLGAVLIYLATEVLPGFLLVGLGIVVEIIGITLNRK